MCEILDDHLSIFLIDHFLHMYHFINRSSLGSFKKKISLLPQTPCVSPTVRNRVSTLQDVGIKVNSRKVLGAVLKNAGVPVTR